MNRLSFSSASTQTNYPLLSFQDISRNFGATKAVSNVTLDLRGGEIHALVGENGAGKSTCLGMAAGRLPPSSGRVLLDGVPVRAGDPRAARRAGIVAVYQELTIVPALSAQANVFLGTEHSRHFVLSEREMRGNYVDMCVALGVAAHPDVRAGRLSTADQQMLEIMRALVVEARVLLLDEPTASLASSERIALFDVMKGLRKKGMAMAMVSHDLDEVLKIADAVTVFRNGEKVQTRRSSEWSKRDLVSAMLGRQVQPAEAAELHRSRRTASGGSEVALSVTGLSSQYKLRDVNLEVRKGEILGIAGLVGSGRTSLLRAIAGLDQTATGSVAVQGLNLGVPRSTRAARKAGIALLPEDRKREGLVLGMVSADNVVLNEYRSITVGPILLRRRVIEAAEPPAKSVAFDPARLSAAARSLSGGNQQKLMLARWRHTDHPILLADEPTRGVDIGARSQILSILTQMVDEGRSLVLVSSDLEEVVGLSDRVLVMAGGRILAEFDLATGRPTVEQILHKIFEVEEQE